MEESYQTNVVQGHRRETSEAKVPLAVSDSGFVSRNDGLWVAGGTTGVDGSDGEELDIGAERWVPVGLVWVGACLGDRIRGGG